MQNRLTIIIVFLVLTIMVTAVIVNSKPRANEMPMQTVYQDSLSGFVPDQYGATIEEREKWALLRDVIACESGSRWVIVEVPGKGFDVGVCQISTHYHSVSAAQKGYDLYRPDQNMLYCIDLFEQYYPVMKSGKGWNPWYVTQDCWQGRQRMRVEQAKLEGVN